MRQKSRVVKILGSLGAFADAALALDAGPGNVGHICRINGAHRTQTDAGATVVALAQVRLGFGLQELGSLSIGSLGHIIGSRSIAGHLDRRRNSWQVI